MGGEVIMKIQGGRICA
uniref:Uncharacterized protein n=1 Tax=mine drainage metagenome TaxID=410659 RepID=E6QE96_9ZZZZ